METSTGILQEDTLGPCLFILGLLYIIWASIDKQKMVTHLKNSEAKNNVQALQQTQTTHITQQLL